MSVVQETTAPLDAIFDVPTEEITGAASAATINVTGIDAGEFCAPDELTVICPV